MPTKKTIYFITLATIIGIIVAAHYLFEPLPVQAQTTFSVAPKTANSDDLMANTNASWNFTIDNTGADAINPGNEIKITFPDIPQGAGRPFSLVPESLSFVTEPVAGLYLADSLMIEGSNHNIVKFTVVAPTNNFSGQFTIALSGVENPVAALAELEKTYAKTWNLEIPGILSASDEISSPISRKGEMIPYDANFDFTLSDYSTDATANYTLKFTAPTSLAVGEKITFQFPSEFDLSGASITAGTDISANTTAQVDGIQTVTTGGHNLVRFLVSNAPTGTNDVLTLTVKGIKNPSTKDVYRGFGLYTTTSNNGVIDGLPMEAGMEPDRKGPPLLESVTIGGDNTVNFTVKKELADGTVTNLTATTETDLVKVGMGCPDKMFFVGDKFLKTNSTATFEGLLDCNYIAFVMPAQDPTLEGETGGAEAEFKDFFDKYLVPGMIEIPASGGQTFNVTLTFIIPDNYITGTITGGPANNTWADVEAFGEGYMSWSPIFQDQTYSFDKVGLDNTGKGYFKLKVKSGKTWRLNMMLHESGGIIKDTAGNEYWAPDLGAVYVPDTTPIDIGTKAFVKADKDLTVNLINSADGSSVTNACVGVVRAGMDFMMCPGEQKCTAPYTFKVPAGSLAIQVMSMDW